jgi:FkbM family methyltransferase
MKSYNQAGQEEWVIKELLHKCTGDIKDAGFFVDIGAYDGIESSNTYVLQNEYKWSGILVEPNKMYYDICKAKRESFYVYCENKAVMPYNGKCALEGFTTNASVIDSRKNVSCLTLNNLLEDYSDIIPSIIDYISIDIEGNELSVLETFNFDKWKVNLWTIEHNFYLIGDVYKSKIYELMTKKGYERVANDVAAIGYGAFEDWYKLKT